MNNQTTTPDAILDAAEELFAAQGFKATTIKQIGAAAGANPALIYYYFGGKETLYHELLRRIFGRLTQAAVHLDPAAPPDQTIRALVLYQSEVLRARPTIPRLIVRELVDHQAEHATEQIVQLSVGVFARLCALIEAGQQAGLFRRDLDARFAAISVVSLVPYLHVARPAVGILLGHGTEGPTPDEMEAYGRHAAEFALAALAARGSGEGERT
jgi:AcrR family transcriptional regulator